MMGKKFILTSLENEDENPEYRIFTTFKGACEKIGLKYNTVKRYWSGDRMSYGGFVFEKIKCE